jgi:ribosomal protein S18 acetylase RimI-like enzyme
VIEVRPATALDAEDIARVLVESWRTTYAGIVHEGYLNNMSVAAQTTRWQSRLKQPDVSAFVAHDETGATIGFAAGGRVREPHDGFDAELYAIYLVAEAQRRGAGRQLLGAWAGASAAKGFRAALVRVLSANPATSFYRRLGARPVKSGSLELDGATYAESWLGWDDLAALAARAG